LAIGTYPPRHPHSPFSPRKFFVLPPFPQTSSSTLPVSRQDQACLITLTFFFLRLFFFSSYTDVKFCYLLVRAIFPGRGPPLPLLTFPGSFCYSHIPQPLFPRFSSLSFCLLLCPRLKTSPCPQPFSPNRISVPFFLQPISVYSHTWLHVTKQWLSLQPLCEISFGPLLRPPFFFKALTLPFPLLFARNTPFFDHPIAATAPSFSPPNLLFQVALCLPPPCHFFFFFPGTPPQNGPPSLKFGSPWVFFGIRFFLSFVSGGPKLLFFSPFRPS